MPRGKSFKVAAEVFFQQSHSFIHSFIQPASQFLPLQIQTLRLTLTPRRTAEKTPRADCRSTWSWRVLLSSEPAMSQPHLGNCWGVSSPSSFFSHPASRKSGFRQPGLPAISQPRFKIAPSALLPWQQQPQLELPRPPITPSSSWLPVWVPEA